MKNLTTGKPLKLIVLFALPLMFGNFLQQLYIVIDTMIVGQYVGVDALASIGGADWINWTIIGILSGFAQGFSIRVSNCLGAEDEKGMEKAIGHCYILCFIIGVIITICGHLLIEPILHLLNTPSETINGSIMYLRVVTSGALVVMFNYCFSALLRAIGDSRTPVIAMVISSIINIALDLYFVRVFHWGIFGVAFATVLAQIFSTLFCFYRLNQELPFSMHKDSFKLDHDLLKKLLKLGMPLSFQSIMMTSGGMILQSVVNGYGFLFIAGYTAANKLYGLLEVVAISFGYAMTTYTSQNYGAKKLKRIKQGIFEGNLLSVGISIIIFLLVLISGKNVLSLFISASPKDAQIVLKYAYDYLFMMAVCLPVLYFLYSYYSALQGLENTLIPMISGFVELLIRVLGALILPRFVGVYGIYFAQVLAWFGSAGLLYVAYKVEIHKIEKRMIEE